MLSDGARTKGLGFANVKTFTIERWAAPGWAAVLQSMDDPDREEMEAVVPVGWYSLALYARLIRTLDRVHGRGDAHLVDELGKFEAERDLKTVHRFFLRFANPVFAIEQMGKYWRRFHDTGYWNVQRIEKSYATGTLCEWGHVDDFLCRELVAYMRRTMELAGASQVALAHPRCRARGGGECLFEVRWAG